MAGSSLGVFFTEAWTGETRVGVSANKEVGRLMMLPFWGVGTLEGYNLV